MTLAHTQSHISEPIHKGIWLVVHFDWTFLDKHRSGAAGGQGQEGYTAHLHASVGDFYYFQPSGRAYP